VRERKRQDLDVADDERRAVGEEIHGSWSPPRMPRAVSPFA
jgi:hypothetical protein